MSNQLPTRGNTTPRTLGERAARYFRGRWVWQFCASIVADRSISRIPGTLRRVCRSARTSSRSMRVKAPAPGSKPHASRAFQMLLSSARSMKSGPSSRSRACDEAQALLVGRHRWPASMLSRPSTKPAMRPSRSATISAAEGPRASLSCFAPRSAPSDARSRRRTMPANRSPAHARAYPLAARSPLPGRAARDG